MFRFFFISIVFLFSSFKNRIYKNNNPIFYGVDSFVVYPIKNKCNYIIYNKYRNKIFKVRLQELSGNSFVEIYNFNKKLISKGIYNSNKINSTDEIVYINSKGKIIGEYGFFNLPCKNGDWEYYNEQGSLLKKEHWICDTLIK